MLNETRIDVWGYLRGWSNTVIAQQACIYMFTVLKKGYGFNESAVPNSILSTVFHQSLNITVKSECSPRPPPVSYDRESIEVRESRRVVLGNIQKQSVFLVEYRGSFRGYPLNYPP